MIIVIGAGISGLSAARKLKAQGHEVVVIEARDRVGGRTLSADFGGARIDLGGQWIGPGQHRVIKLAKELGLQTFAQWDKGKKVQDFGGNVRHYGGLIPWFSLGQLVESGYNMAKLEWMCRRALHEKWDRLSVEDWLAQNLKGEGSRALLKLAAQMILCAEPRDLSFLFFLDYLRSGQGPIRLSSIRGGAQQDRFVEGAQALSLGLARGLDVRFNHAVKLIRQTSDGVEVDGQKGSHVIVAIPPPLQDEITFEPGLPQKRSQLMVHMPMGSAIKVIVAYAKPFWRERGLSGESLSDAGPLRATFDDTSHDGKHAALVGFIVGDAAQAAHADTREQRKAAVVAQLVRLFGSEAAQPTDYIDQDWIGEQWSRGCYTGVMAPGTWTQWGDALRTPVGRVHFAGTETAQHWTGYFDGAIEAGERAADEVSRNVMVRGKSRQGSNQPTTDSSSVFLNS